MDYMKYMNNIDIKIFEYINGNHSIPGLDTLMLVISNDRLWVVVSVICIGYGFIRGWTDFVYKVTSIIITISLTDLAAYRILKPYFARPRPCYAFPDLVQLVPGGCGSPYGFPSNHASNAAAVAVAVLLLAGPRIARWFFALALIVGISRVYLGVHYPGDVLAGFVFGAVMAYAVHFSLLRIVRGWRS